jgi:hypothetical protein
MPYKEELGAATREESETGLGLWLGGCVRHMSTGMAVDRRALAETDSWCLILLAMRWHSVGVSRSKMEVPGDQLEIANARDEAVRFGLLEGSLEKLTARTCNWRRMD